MNLIKYPLKILKYQLYIFQLEEYDLKIFLRSLFRKGLFPSNNLRKNLIWTNKARLIFSITLFIQILLSISIGYLLNRNIFNTVFSFILFFITFYILVTIFSFIFLIQSSDLIKPLEIYLKRRIIISAKNKVKVLKNLKIIAITGSYGKTTMKEVLFTVLNQKFNVVKTESSNNTPLSISKTILDKINDETEIFIVEMGEYYKGDVKQLCEITPPDISIITGINEAHLEKYGSMNNAISTKFEIIEFSKKNSYYLLNYDDKLIKDNYRQYIEDINRLEFYSSNIDNDKIKNYSFNQDGTGQSFEIKDIGKVKVSFLGEYIIGNILASTVIAKKLDMSDSEIRLAISKLQRIEHRLEPRFNQQNILIIDDTYNGNTDGIKEGIKLLNKFTNRRKIYMTPGLVETGASSDEIHLKIGQDLSKVANKVILIKNSVTPNIFKGLKSSGFNDSDIIWYPNSKIALKKFGEQLKANDVLLMQNDWSDNYS